MFCSKCGNKIADDAAFCSNCGASVNNIPTPIVKENNSLEKIKDKDELAKYFEYAKELEVERYTLQETFNKIEHKISTLGISKEFKEVDTVGNFGSSVAAGGWLFGIIGAIIGLIVLTVKMQQNGNSLIWNLIMELEIVKLPILALIIGLFSAGLGMLVGLIYASVTDSDEKKRRQEAIDRDDERVFAEMDQMEQLYDQEKQIESKIAQIENTLSRLYDLDVIFPKYRNLVAVVTMHEYLISGRCSELTGPYGTYTLYESESRQNRIICDLNQIKSMLADIRDMQHAIYEAIEESNYISGQIYSQNESLLASNRKIEENSAIAAYNSKLIETNTKISAYIDVFTYYN